MPLEDLRGERRTFFGDPVLDHALPAVNEAFWSALIEHVGSNPVSQAGAILDVGCHTGGLLEQLCLRFQPTDVFGIEPLAAARDAARRRLEGSAARVTLLDTSEWSRVPAAKIDLITSHETLYLEPDLRAFMVHLRAVLAPSGLAFIVLGCHSENPLWQQWKVPLIAAGHLVYDHSPIEIMHAAASAGLLPSVQPLRRAGWITYDPLRADFHYPDVRTMFDHHYRHKLIFRLRVADDRNMSS